MVKYLLHLEGFAIFLLSVLLYKEFGSSWTIFIVLFLTPDLSMIGYAINQRIGAASYNLIHTYVLALLLMLIGSHHGMHFLFVYGLILAAHIGLDRAIGFGLKYPEGFKKTHLQKV